VGSPWRGSPSLRREKRARARCGRPGARLGLRCSRGAGLRPPGGAHGGGAAGRSERPRWTRAAPRRRPPTCHAPRRSGRSGASRSRPANPARAARRSGRAVPARAARDRATALTGRPGGPRSLSWRARGPGPGRTMKSRRSRFSCCTTVATATSRLNGSRLSGAWKRFTATARPSMVAAYTVPKLPLPSVLSHPLLAATSSRYGTSATCGRGAVAGARGSMPCRKRCAQRRGAAARARAERGRRRPGSPGSRDGRWRRDLDGAPCSGRAPHALRRWRPGLWITNRKL
jgi:hypothetical protein